ncbi:auxin-responsive protein IAA6-like isoform X2 [Typha angustifolia]|uniref:auxin-responsive protein IAA6-like isoform X2 n=1 Tax=Typha angustifolia TaxID=59011 RepID=UPI003C2CD528
MEEGSKRRVNPCPKLLDLIPNERHWMVRDPGGGGGKSGLGAEEERKLELKLGPPGREEEPSILSLGYFSKASKTTTNIYNLYSGAKRGFLDTVETKPKDHHQQQQNGLFQLNDRAGLGKEVFIDTSGKAEQQLRLERKACSQTRTGTAPVVGWPPIRSFRKNIASSSSKPSLLGSQNEEGEVKAELSFRKGLLVKINMDGIPIGRKVDLKIYDSYEKLPLAVEELFRGLLEAQKDPSVVESRNHGEEEQTFSGLLDGTGKYTLVYEDREGDRMLVGDVPWDMFLATARRLRVLKTSELSGLSLGGVCRKRNTTTTTTTTTDNNKVLC